MDDQSSGSLFRSVKRRKITRKPFNDEKPERSSKSRSVSPSIDNASVPISPDFGAAVEAEEAEVSVSEALRRRKLGKARRAGIQFSSTADGQQRTEDEGSRPLAPIQSAVEVANNRFAPQTGKVADVLDKHM
jgi:hypothetical protein